MVNINIKELPSENVFYIVTSMKYNYIKEPSLIIHRMMIYNEIYNMNLTDIEEVVPKAKFFYPYRITSIVNKEVNEYYNEMNYSNSPLMAACMFVPIQKIGDAIKGLEHPELVRIICEDLDGYSEIKFNWE